jgi:hypothetical protein
METHCRRWNGRVGSGAIPGERVWVYHPASNAYRDPRINTSARNGKQNMAMIMLFNIEMY